MKIIQIAHNHPAFHPGGTENVAISLHREALAQGHDSYFLGATDPTQRGTNPGTNMIAMTDDGRENVIWFGYFSRFELRQSDFFGGLRELSLFVREIVPDVIHFHHFLLFGLEAIFAVRRAAPRARIILTLHDYYAICPSNGQLYLYESKSRCDGPSLIKCAKCFPNRRAEELRLRKLAVNDAFSQCDAIVSPSHFLKRKVGSHLSTPEIRVIENAYLGAANIEVTECASDRREIVFGYFGNISEVKGLADLLEAVDIVARDEQLSFQLVVHGAQLFEDSALAKAIKKARRRHPSKISFRGGYQSENAATLMSEVDVVVFPSVWWENAPLTIYEAIAAGRQVLCYPHSAATEILERYEVGIIATGSSPRALADKMLSILHNPELVQTNPSASIRTPEKMFREYLDLYIS
jgi:glycosyltransferase involved in cell wall biosynthesis